MQQFKVNKKETEDVVKNIFYLAWEASGVFGLGFLHDKPATKEEVWNNVCTAGDYPANIKFPDKVIYADYVFGRMMKLRVKMDKKKGIIEIDDNTPRPDYQSWCRKYNTYKDLVEEAINKTQTEKE